MAELSPYIWTGIFKVFEVLVVGLILGLFTSRYQKRREVPRYDYSFFNDSNEFLMTNLKESIIFTRNLEIKELITDFAGLAIIHEAKNNIEKETKA